MKRRTRYEYKALFIYEAARWKTALACLRLTPKVPNLSQLMFSHGGRRGPPLPRTSSHQDSFVHACSNASVDKACSVFFIPGKSSARATTSSRPRPSAGLDRSRTTCPTLVLPSSGCRTGGQWTLWLRSSSRSAQIRSHGKPFSMRRKPIP